jgi:hypothetical protein
MKWKNDDKKQIKNKLKFRLRVSLEVLGFN